MARRLSLRLRTGLLLCLALVQSTRTFLEGVQHFKRAAPCSRTRRCGLSQRPCSTDDETSSLGALYADEKKRKSAGCLILRDAVVSSAEGKGAVLVAERELSPGSIVTVERPVRPPEVPEQLHPRSPSDVPDVAMGLPLSLLPASLYRVGL
eukprot:TRINITY_DN26034_c0_g1_i1.p2 TRINITY_DN26034_c0_g1~~TRINITY_DN26034_c0_g1_i1.p2  ORF type:complete len:151 (-),score=17.09 TRINITY_DN26034_c0_g1_i1:951-1403(-)